MEFLSDSAAKVDLRGWVESWMKFQGYSTNRIAANAGMVTKAILDFVTGIRGE